jgi:16S rRNA (adenine1518-N6/adenine1519-N6)-dimethyltransferase
MPLSPLVTRDLLDPLGPFTRRGLGQNFLVDGKIVNKSVELAGVRAGDSVVEIGPGLGAINEQALANPGSRCWPLAATVHKAASKKSPLPCGRS